ncbi:MAG: insulinase family protein [Blastocatellia bacterium]
MPRTIPRISRVLLTCVLLGASVSAQKKAVAPAAVPPVKYQETKLKNGLRVFLVEDHSAPVISLALIYDTGSRNEKPGRTGFAHLFEHMMFQGSANVGKGEYMMLVFNNGGQLNGTTNEERTLYFEILPAN